MATAMMPVRVEMDAAWMPALRAFAQLRHMTIEQAAVVLLRQGLAKGVTTDASRCECERCVNERERDARRRRRNGIVERVQVIKPEPETPWIPKGVEQVCPICDGTFEQRPGKGRKQLYCDRGNRTCMKYAQRYGIEVGRKKYAAKH